MATLETNAVFDREWVDAAVEWLVRSTPIGLVVDVGCGAGGAARAFAARLPAGSRVIAVDPDPRLLAIAEREAQREHVADRIEWSVAEIGALPVAQGSADIAWASGVVHHVADQQVAVSELAALVRPGGRVALVEGGIPMRCLPHEIGVGQPGLESRLEAARTRWFVDMRTELSPVPMPYGWPEALARAGLIEVGARSFIAERTPPLDEVGRKLVEHHLTAAQDQLGDRLDSDDRATLGRLLDPDDAAFVGRRDDLIVTAARTVLVGTKP